MIFKVFLYSRLYSELHKIMEWASILGFRSGVAYVCQRTKCVMR